MPASVFSRSTEAHNQDKVSMGTIAARDCLRVLQLTEQVAAAHTLATVQAARLRLRGNAATVIPEPLSRFMEEVGASSPFVDEDRALEHELRAMTERIASGDFIGQKEGDRS
jgi:histidine ammonia-lyase